MTRLISNVRRLSLRREPGPPKSDRRRGERGALLLCMFTFFTVMGIMSGMAIQEWSVIEQREREQQLIFIQEQYAAGILAFQKEQGRPPMNLDELTKKGQKGMFLRQPYVDPMMPKATLADWCLLRTGGAGRVVSSCTAEGQEGLGQGLGSKFKVGDETSAPRPNQQQVPGLPPGATGIVGVHSKSSKHAYNTLKRSEETYDRWYYTIEDYRKEMSKRGIPGINQSKGPGLGGPGGTDQPRGQGGTRQPGQSGFKSADPGLN